MLQHDTVRAWDFGTLEHCYTERDTMLYALSIGLGADPLDSAQLRYVWERELLAMPSMAANLCAPGPWARDARTGIDGTRIVHGEQDVRILRPLPPAATLHARARVTGLADKGPGRGAIVEVTRDILSPQDELLAQVRHVSFCRGDGGFSEGAVLAPWAPHALPAVPDRAPDQALDLTTLPQSALLYRLCGDLNPLHVDPQLALSLGFHAPILHGLCSYGMATRAVLQACCGMDAGRLRRMAVRFSAPVFPGETISFHIWHAGDGAAHLQARVATRDAVVLNNGWFEYEPA